MSAVTVYLYIRLVILAVVFIVLYTQLYDISLNSIVQEYFDHISYGISLILSAFYSPLLCDST